MSLMMMRMIMISLASIVCTITTIHPQLLRSSLVNNRTQAVVCDDLGMTSYAMYSHLKTELKTKDRADLLEAFLGALYIDRMRKWHH